jgi:hypothetical protein
VFSMSAQASPSSAPPTDTLQAPQRPNPSLNVKDLGKRMIAGHEVEGKSYTFPSFQPPKGPTQPGAPQARGAPQSSPPQSPAPPGASQAPTAPQLRPPHVMEVWTSPKLQLPLASRVTGGIGKQTTICKQVVPGEPAASKFQIPAGYKLVKPPAPPNAPPTSS